MNNANTQDFDAALSAFVAFVQGQETDYWNTCSASESGVDMSNHIAQVIVMRGKKYARIVKTCGAQRTAFCFVNLTTGAVLKCATWKAPAKTARGSIFTDTPSNETYGVSLHGAHYLR